MIRAYNIDCTEFMQRQPDKAFDLAIVDPPYGDGGWGQWAGRSRGRFGGRFDKYKIGGGTNKMRTGGSWSVKYQKNSPNTNGGVFSSDIRHWDFAPEPEYFAELFRVSKNQIIWGGNYFELPPTRCFVVWRKLSISESFSMAMCEYAWTSFIQNAKYFECAPQGTAKEPRIHPTQKPVALYKWLMTKFAKPGWKLLDTHGGSFSSAIAAHELGFDLDICEIDADYFKAGKERLENIQQQLFFANGRCNTGGLDMMSNIGLDTNRAMIADFVDYCRADGKSRKTIGCHKTALSAASKYINRPFPQVTADGWREAVVAAAEERGWTRNSIWQANSAVRALCRWMYATGISEAVSVNRKPGGSGRPSKEELSVRVKFFGTEDPQQIFTYRGKPVSAIAVAALRLAMRDGFLYRVVMSDAERAAVRGK